MKMKTLYALLVILIVFYISINLGANGIDILNVTNSQTNGSADTTVTGDVSFPKLEGFSETKVNDNAIKYVNNNTGVTILLQKIDNSQNISDIYNSLSKEGTYTSSQNVDQNGITTYYLYKEGQSSYSAEIYFNKHNQNFKISGNNITYENSDYFIKNCKMIIDTI